MDNFTFSFTQFHLFPNLYSGNPSLKSCVCIENMYVISSLWKQNQFFGCRMLISVNM
jgi:hypothetical protein